MSDRTIHVLQPAITSNAERTAVNEANTQAIDKKFDELSDRIDDRLVGFGSELLDLKDSLNELSKDIAVLNERAKGN